MKRVFWTPEARACLADIESHIANDSPSAAKEMVTRILARPRQLETTPLSGRQVPDYRQADLRELLERPYRIIYRVTAEQVEVLSVMHYRKRLPRKTKDLGRGSFLSG